jgi:uncharacterized tellurite resistance protein B-like protein
LDESVRIELIKLLFRVAAADREVVSAERGYLRRVMRRFDVPRSVRDDVRVWLDGAAWPPEPDLEVLRAHRVEVLAYAKRMAEADDVVHEEERGLLAEVAWALADPPQ